MSAELNQYDFDPDALRKKYRSERDKRLRQDGNEQYQEQHGVRQVPASQIFRSSAEHRSYRRADCCLGGLFPAVSTPLT